MFKWFETIFSLGAPDERKNIKLEEKSIPAAWMYLFNKLYGQVICPVLLLAINSSTYLSLQNLTSQQRKLASSLKRENPAKAATQIAAVRKSDKLALADANF